MLCCALVTVAVTGTSKDSPVGAIVIFTLPEYVPVASPVGLALTSTEAEPKAGAKPLVGATVNQFPPVFVVVVAEKFLIVLLRLLMEMELVAGVPAPWVRLKLDPFESTATVGPDAPVTVKVA